MSLAHLSDAERMFFVALLLNETVAWIRSKPGTSSLRAVLYMDEVFGFLPPVANPPSKKPMLTLLKQARASGLGVVVATQNPVDLDYKALSNIGTWFLGRLQTERDKARVLDGLEGVSTAAGAAFDRAGADRLLSGLRSRVFLLHNVHDETPVLFESRWAMSYLAGPLDRGAIRRLAGADAPASEQQQGGFVKAKDEDRSGTAFSEGKTGAAAGASATAFAAAALVTGAAGAPVLAPEISQVFLPSESGRISSPYTPALLGFGRIYFEDARRGVSTSVESARLARFGSDGTVDWVSATAWSGGEADLADRPAPDANFAALPARAQKLESYDKWSRDLATALARTVTLPLLRSAVLGEHSRPGEAERDFRIRLADRARERRDAEIEKVRAKYAAKVAASDERLRRAESKIETEKQQADAQKWSSALSGAASVAGVLFGRRRISATNITRVG
ncbi:MAG: ATP-binding protein, partial [Myxococcota bacterium]